MRSLRSPLHAAALALVLTFAVDASAQTLDLTQRKVDVVGKLNVASANKIADKLVSFDAQAVAPIYLMITATDGTAQAVLVVADVIRSLKSPVVSVVMTQVHGAGAALAPFGDQVMMYPSSALVFTELAYEGVAKPKPPKEGDKPKEPTAHEKLLQEARRRFLDTFHQKLAKRILWKPNTLRAKLEEGGFVMTAEEAVRGKVATAIVDQITYTQLREVKREVKVITTEKRNRTAPPSGD